jgi:hypothetical protein
MAKKPPKPPATKTVALTDELWARIDLFRDSRPIWTDREAVRILIEAGLDALEVRPARQLGMRVSGGSSDYLPEM